MSNQTRITVIHAISPLHAGTGQGVGDIDLPIARETATGIPYLPGSSLKGSLRAACDEKYRVQIFGPETANASDHAGSVLISDQRLLLLPVRCLAGTFAWVTSPYVLGRFQRDLRDAGIKLPTFHPTFAANELQCVYRVKTSINAIDNQVILEDLDLVDKNKDEAATEEFADRLGKFLFAGDEALATALKQRLCIVHDDIFSFLLETATEITARIRLDPDKKTVAKGALWYEEALPTETILTGLAIAMPSNKVGMTVDAIFDQLDSCARSVVQLGGKSTVGRGLCRVTLSKGV